MSVDYRLHRKNNRVNKYLRNSKKQKDLDCSHLPMRFARGWKYCRSKTYHVIDRWLTSQVGRPIDKVFSEFCKEYKRNSSYYSPMQEFRKHIVYDRKECTKYKRLYVSNGILNIEKLHKIKSPCCKGLPYVLLKKVNKGLELLNENKLSELCKKAPVMIGRYYASNLDNYDYKLSSIYLVSIEDWKKVIGNNSIGEDLEFLLHCERCKVMSSEGLWNYRGISTIWTPCLSCGSSSLNYVFVRKIKRV